MTPTPPSTTSSSAGGHSPDATYRVVRKRNRVPLSCAPCRHRKLKCNRSHPCENCVRRGDAAGCSYAAPGTRKKNQGQGNSSPDDMQNRIDRLEGLVLSLMTNGAQSAGPTAAQAAISRSTSESGPSSARSQEVDADDNDMIKEEEEDSDVESVSNSFGILKVDNDQGKTMYVGDSHWHLVLADIAEVKNYFHNHKRELEAQYSKVKATNPVTALGGPAFLFATSTATEAELRGALPSRSAIEKLVSRYFNSLDPAVNILHYPTFHKNLQEWLPDYSKDSVVWIGLIYAILTLAMQSYHKIGDEPPEWKGRTLELASEYRLRTVQCLITADYTKSALYTIETLLLYVHGEYASRWDAEVGIWVVVGMVVRLAIRMGYHRDSKHFPSISPYNGEMRRRVWAFLRQSDIMFSFQLALPSMIKASDCDAELPRNIFEDEFGPETTVLPSPRPITEPTPISYMVSKATLAYTFGEILEELNSLAGRSASYDEVMRKDQKLRDVQANLPPHLKLRPLEDSILDPATLLMQRFYLEILYQKAMCVLHRKYLARARTNPRYAHSRRACVEAAMTILKHQETLNRESQVGGRLHTMKWFISSLTKHDFLLGAMVVCLDLHYDSVAESYDRYFWTAEQRADMLRALERSQIIWKESAEKSIEAFKASSILEIMVKKLQQTSASQQTASNGTDQRTTSEVFASFDENLQPEHSAAMTLGMLSSGGMTPNTSAMFNSGAALSPGGIKYGPDMQMGDGSGSTGMTPNFMMDSNAFAGNMNSVTSPFSQVFGNIGGANGMVDLPANLDWDAWDSYVQHGNTMDPSLQFYPGAFDASTPSIPQDGQLDPNVFNNSVFMGANTPGRNA